MDPVHVFFLSLLVLIVCAVVFSVLYFVVEEFEEEHRPVAQTRPQNVVSSTGLPRLPDLSPLGSSRVGVSYVPLPPRRQFVYGSVAPESDDSAKPPKKRPVWYRRRGVRRCICVAFVFAFVVAAGTLIYVLNVEGVKTLGEHGFEWTERYATVLPNCGGRTLLSTRMRYIGSGKYIPVIRSEHDKTATVLWGHSLVGYNPTIFCMNNTPYMIGSANIELHINVLASAPATGRISILNLDTLDIFEASVPMDSCFDEMFDDCGLDSKFSMVFWENHWTAYIRANPVSGGGGRHVQLIKSYDSGVTWTPFVLVEIDGVTPYRESNIYFFDVYNINRTHIGARFPAVFEGEGGVFETESSDSIHWTAPRKVRDAVAHGQRTTMHPVGADRAMRINTHFQTHQVELFQFGFGDSLNHDGTFLTRYIV
jgi:hypothetical protein